MNLPLVCLGILATLSAVADTSFPKAPDPKLTPGSLCDSSKSIRYPERISYCERNVDSSIKKTVIENYDQILGFEVGHMNRAEFKIDHYIPLCMGGSNEMDNLWPQHSSVYQYTDPIEDTACKKMAAGRLKQDDALKMIRKAKANVQEAVKILKVIEKL